MSAGNLGRKATLRGRIEAMLYPVLAQRHRLERYPVWPPGQSIALATARLGASDDHRHWRNRCRLLGARGGIVLRAPPAALGHVHSLDSLVARAGKPDKSP